ncbi:substrate-binding periplasmic protein [Methylobacterium pseudosasicola]|uniref:Amino acid ABC transporter substrate-binding protein, PAAT family n=1 Tax=Methylobacterium pseudosasicola TaxID=582667 RepID=A0A1I4LZJ6_9HYPH|nr:transporter substrate-binding domain-containing protein [Methylobacterium pseudosasicola]SFL96588.1 amino acid ABC transporter substrate-binding protein, PAAT family [Methylobacterium pseudosasicola]
MRSSRARLILAACGLLLAARFQPEAAARPLDQVVADGTLRVAVYGDNAPFSEEAAGKPRGIDADLARAIADKLKVKLDLRVVDAGENVDGDFRLNLWRGDLAGSPLADLMLHVPTDRQLALRNDQVFFTAPYFDQEIAFAYRKGALEGFDRLDDIGDNTVAVEGASAADLMLLTAQGGRFRAGLKHFKSFDEAAKAYLAGEAPILAGTRAAIEAALFAAKAPREDNPIGTVPSQGLVKTRWEIGGAVKTDSRDLAYAVGDAITALNADGHLKAICETYGVTYTPPKGY